MPQDFPFPTQPELVAVTIAYRNEAYIADDVLPRVPVARKEFRYLEFPKEAAFTVPDSRVGRTSEVNRVELTATQKAAACEDYALDEPLPADDLEEASAQGLDWRGRAVQYLTDLVLLGRELRVSQIVFDAANYGASEALTGTQKFSDEANSKPIQVIGDALDQPLLRPNVMVIGQAAWTVLRRHPDIVKAAHGNAGDRGMASRQAVADLFELEEILVGRSWLNTARKGQTPVMQRVWGPHIALIHRNRNADTRGGVTFGYTAQRGGRIAGSYRDPKTGARGAEIIRVGESVKELIVAPDAGYLIQNVV